MNGPALQTFTWAWESYQGVLARFSKRSWAAPPEELRAFVRTEIQKMAKAVRSSGAKVD
jgi:hypothetical protein